MSKSRKVTPDPMQWCCLQFSALAWHKYSFQCHGGRCLLKYYTMVDDVQYIIIEKKRQPTCLAAYLKGHCTNRQLKRNEQKSSGSAIFFWGESNFVLLFVAGYYIAPEMTYMSF